MSRRNFSVFAHRGARSLAPENTLSAIQKAWQIGSDGVEVDIRASLDGELVLFHDTYLARTTDAARLYATRAIEPLENFTLAELQKLNAGSWFVTSDPFGQIRVGAIPESELDLIRVSRIPRMLDLLDFIKDKPWRLNLEIKPRPPSAPPFPIAETILDVLERERVAPEKIILSSFHHDYLRIIATRRPDLEIQALIGGERKKGNDWGDFEFKTYNANASYIDESQVKAAHQRGCTVNLYTVNDTEQMRRFRSWGVQTIISDFPQFMFQ